MTLREYTVKNIPSSFPTRPVRMGIENVSPVWFTSVMGTGILAIVMSISPLKVPLIDTIAQVLWVCDVVLFAILLLLWLVQVCVVPAQIAKSLRDVAQAQTWGAPPMACFTVATGFLLIGNHLLSPTIYLPCAQCLWLLGVIGSCFSVLIIPLLMFTQHEVSRETTYGNWLLPVVPPIVASVPGALLAPHWPLPLRSDMLALTYVLWGIGIILAAIIIVLFYARLAYHKIPVGPLVPTLWLVVGPLGQSVAGMNAMGNAAVAIWPSVGPALHVAALVYGLPVWGFGVYWLTLAIIVTIRAAIKHLPFNLGWWAFTFPVGVLTSGTYALYALTKANLFIGMGLILLGLLALMWVLVAIRTLYHTFHASVIRAEVDFI